MKRFNHTPGPWSYTILGPYRNNMAVLDIEINYGKDGECIADTVYEEANARLIASSPLMLEGLIMSYNLLKTWGIGNQVLIGGIIEKATGMTIDDALAAYAEKQKNEK